MKYIFEFEVSEGATQDVSTSDIKQPTYFLADNAFVFPMDCFYIGSPLQCWSMPYGFNNLGKKSNVSGASEVEATGAPEIIPPLPSLSIADMIRLVSVIRCAPDKFGEVK